MAVLIQELDDVMISGIMSTYNINSGYKGEIILKANYGLDIVSKNLSNLYSIYSFVLFILIISLF